MKFVLALITYNDVTSLMNFTIVYSIQIWTYRSLKMTLRCSETSDPIIWRGSIITEGWISRLHPCGNLKTGSTV